MSEIDDNPIRQAAFAYRDRGWSVIPLVACDKTPKMRWTPYQRGVASAGKVADWFEAWPDANLGIVTGAVSGVVVLDIDSGHGGDDSLAEMVARHEPLPMTAEVHTGGGGRHLFFRHPGGTVGNRVGLLRGVDLRGDGGYVVAAPSIHPSGRPYAWAPGRHPDEAGIADMPAWLLDIVSDDPERRGHPLAHWRTLVSEGVREGQRNNTVASMTGHLLWHGVDPQVTLELLLAWNRMRCRPPLADDEVAHTVESILRLHQAGQNVNDLPPSVPHHPG